MTSEMKRIKIWHPAFDAYHCSFRIIRILLHTSSQELATEVLYIFDFYVLYPFLLRRASMPQEVRREFGRLKIEHEREQFMQYPSSPTLFRELAVYQNAATSRLAAKNMLDRDAYLSGSSRLNISAVPETLIDQAKLANQRDSEFMDFLVRSFGVIELTGSRGLRSLTGLVRRRS